MPEKTPPEPRPPARGILDSMEDLERRRKKKAQKAGKAQDGLDLDKVW